VGGKNKKFSIGSVMSQGHTEKPWSTDLYGGKKEKPKKVRCLGGKHMVTDMLK
jgi:hypothetical protein